MIENVTKNMTIMSEYVTLEIRYEKRSAQFRVSRQRLKTHTLKNSNYIVGEELNCLLEWRVKVAVGNRRSEDDDIFCTKNEFQGF